jgi:UDP-N-acetylbacillosamine transaminase
MDDFDTWNELKKKTNISQQPLYFKEGDIWWIKIGKNIGVEILGKGENFLRPVFVLKKVNKYSCIVVPITKTKKNNIFYYSFSFKNKAQNLAFNQIKTVDTKRFVKKFGQTSESTLNKIKQYFISIIK